MQANNLKNQLFLNNKKQQNYKNEQINYILYPNHNTLPTNYLLLLSHPK